MSNKIVMNDGKRDTLVCESIDQFHGQIVVKLLNGNYSSKHRAVHYKLVAMEYEMKQYNEPDQMNLVDFGL